MSASYLESLFDLSGQVAVVIGGTGELCGAMSEALAGAGAQVVLVGRSAAKAEARIAKIAEAGGKAVFIPCDVSEHSALEGLLAAVLEQFGRVDILVNGAGVNSATPFFEIPQDEAEWIMKVNYHAVVSACQIFGRYLVDRGEGGAIINVGSMSGVLPLSRVFTYSASKAALHSISKNLAREWAPHRVRVNTLVPGFFPAEQNRKVLNEKRIEDIMRHTPANRFGEAQELAGATLLLASAKAGGFINGLELLVDGGYASMTI